MNISFQSTVIICNDLEKMADFYTNILGQEIEVDYGGCIGLKGGLSLWKLTEEYPIAQKMGRTFSKKGNENLELCFETEDFEAIAFRIKEAGVNYLHEATEEVWGQMTTRFYDPEGNLIEVGETVPCFVKRFYKQGMSVEEVNERTRVPLEYIKIICKEN